MLTCNFILIEQIIAFGDQVWVRNVISDQTISARGRYCILRFKKKVFSP